MRSRLSTKLRRGGRLPQKHGGYSYLTSGKLPENRTYILNSLTSSEPASLIVSPVNRCLPASRKALLHL